MVEHQTRFAVRLRQALRGRDGVSLPEERLDRAAYVITHGTMGLVHSSIWEEASPIADDLLEREIVGAICAYWRSGA